VLMMTMIKNRLWTSWTAVEQRLMYQVIDRDNSRSNYMYVQPRRTLVKFVHSQMLCIIQLNGWLTIY